MYTIKPISSVKAEINIPPDKSIFQRAIIISSISEGKTIIRPFVVNDDIMASLNCIKRLGIETKINSEALTIYGNGLYFPVKGNIGLYADQSATTLRILSGILCGQKFSSYFDAGSSLRRRPMSRITKPLRFMGADIVGIKKDDEEYPPILINPVKNLKCIKYKLPVASAQVKSAIILASLYAEGKTEIIEPYITRDHTERLLSLYGVEIKRKNKIITLERTRRLKTTGELFIPSDFSSASFFIALALILKNSEILLKNININRTRCGFLNILKRMDADIKIINKRDYFEPYADILVKSSSLKATEVKISEVPLMIDEIPIFCIVASFAKGISVIYGVKELTVKESNRINSIITNLKKVGVDINVERFNIKGKEDLSIKIRGKKDYRDNVKFKSFNDHRIAMSMIILGKALNGKSYIDDINCINKSFGNFLSIIESL